MGINRWSAFLILVALVLSVHSNRRSDDERGNEEERDKRQWERYSSPTKDCVLRAYNADTEGHLVKKWHDLIKTPIDEKTAMTQLLLESCDDEKKDINVMCVAFVTARQANLCVPGLTKAECTAVTMYTAESGGFYSVFNNASAHGDWLSYRVYTSLLYSAVKKLSAIEPVPIQAELYRGMRIACGPPKAKKIFWKTFTSTSLDGQVANLFGMETSLVFQPKATIYGARIRNLSLIDFEDEVLIPPFEMFDFVKADRQKFYFAVSKTQDLLHDISTGNRLEVDLMTALLAFFIITMFLG